MTENTSEQFRDELDPARFGPSGLADDVKNTWSEAFGYPELDLFDQIQPLPTYESYFKQKDAEYKKSGKTGYYDAIMAKSNLKSVEAYNKIIAEFNDALPKLKQEKSVGGINEYLGRLDKLYKNPPEKEANSSPTQP